mmetsp:Transcript_28263/g.59698  ORF Transcript_28263/g.59698 Transcript_28263/m.59698 type:complete len:569 (+) Transcript_28263:1414-3120(+)
MTIAMPFGTGSPSTFTAPGADVAIPARLPPSLITNGVMAWTRMMLPVVLRVHLERALLLIDLYSALRLNDSCIGRGFYLNGPCNGYSNACIGTDLNGGMACTGVREIDYLNKARGLPSTLTWALSNCGGGVHCLGYVYSEAVWKLYTVDLQTAPYNYDSTTALEIVQRLTYIAAGTITSWYSTRRRAAPFGGCSGNSGYKAYLNADDDDGNVNNGTPHMTAIFNAFNRQEIACDDLTVQDSGSCEDIADQPVVTATKTGTEGEVMLSWSSVANAGRYQVFRTEGVFGCSQGKVILATTAGLNHLDTGIQEGRTYNYVVIPKGVSPSCFGKSSECVEVNFASTPAPQTFSPSPVPSISNAPTDTLTELPTATPTKSLPPTESFVPTLGYTTIPWDFESGDLDGWQVVEGTFTNANGVLKSSSNANSVCDRIKSPPLLLTSESTLSISTWIDVEPKSKGAWYDRVNIALYYDGARRIITPDGGRLYNVSGKTGGDFACSVTGNEGLGSLGWGGALTSWQQSTFSAATLGLNLAVGETKLVQIDIYYGTDAIAVGSGFQFDDVSVTVAKPV